MKLTNLIQEFSDLFPDVPQKTNLVYHDVDVGDSSPIKQHPYRMNPVKQEHCHSEIAYMLEHDIIEHSNIIVLGVPLVFLFPSQMVHFGFALTSAR